MGPSAHQAETLRKLPPFFPRIILCHSCSYWCLDVTQEGNTAKRNLPKPGDCRSGVGSECRQTDQCLHHLLLNHSAEPAPCEWEAAIRNSPWQSLRPEQYRRTLLLVREQREERESSSGEAEQREERAAQGRRQPHRGFLVPPYTFTALGSNPSHVCSWAYTKYQPPGSLEYFISRICHWERVIASLPIGMAFFLFSFWITDVIFFLVNVPSCNPIKCWTE